MTTNDIRRKYLEFFRANGHLVVPSASLIPENDPTVLFTTAGMHPLVPYLLGEPHPAGKRLASCQKCIRTGDIDEVGDNRHLTFFEMLGNWSLGDYFKKEAIAWSFGFLTGREWLGLDPERLYVSVFAGDADAPRDDESAGYWREQFASVGVAAELGGRIRTYPKSKNWWGPAGQTGPCGPDTEMFYDTLGLADPAAHAPGWSGVELCHQNCDCGRYVEIWNDVFMQYSKTADGRYEPLKQKNVDTGMGLERTAMIMQGAATVFETDAFQPLIRDIGRLSGRAYGSDEGSDWATRIVADHIRAAVFILGDERGVTPSNVDQGYILRRLIRRAVRYGRHIGIQGTFLPKLAETVIGVYGDQYPTLRQNRQRIMDELAAEDDKFSRTLQRGLQEAKKMWKSKNTVMIRHIPEGSEPALPTMSGDDAFYLYETFGFPKELTEEETGLKVDEAGWSSAMKKHQEMSRAGAEQKFKGGLADNSEAVVRLHTATHLLHAALRQVLGTHVEQRGSNITAERLRFDFSHPRKLTPDEIKKVEAIVNGNIAARSPVVFEMMTVAEAKAAGAMGLFEEKYAALGTDKVKVYTVGNEAVGIASREICGGPHAANTGDLGGFRIVKEEASSAGIRRIKAVIGNES